MLYEIQICEHQTPIFMGESGGRLKKMEIQENTGTFSLTVLCVLLYLLIISHN